VGSFLSAVSAFWQRFRGAPSGVQAGVWVAIGILVAVIGLSLEKNPVKQSQQLAAREHVQVNRSRTPKPKFVGGHLPRPAKGPIDPQLQAGATPKEVKRFKGVAKNFHATTASLTKLFDATLGSRGRYGLNANKLISAKCDAGKCNLQYIPDGPGAGRVLETQGPIWSVLIQDPKWKEATISAVPGGPDIRSRGGKPTGGGPPAGKGPGTTSITCDRAGVIKVGVWGIQAAPRIKQFCKIGQLVDLPGH
jgi:hypothetical protein